LKPLEEVRPVNIRALAKRTVPKKGVPNVATARLRCNRLRHLKQGAVSRDGGVLYWRTEAMGSLVIS
jgi:hypothetical protein